MAVIGYARVSTTDQNPQLQLDALEEAGATRVFTDCGVSGSTACRPHLDACLDHLREGDVLSVWKLDRLGRNTQHVLAVVDELTSRGIGFRSLTEGLHTEGPMGTAMLTIMAAFAQLERDTMIERTRAGLAAAAANGRKGGRPRKVDDADAAKARQLREKGITAADIAKMLGVSRATAYRYSVRERAALCVTPRGLRCASNSAPVRGVGGNFHLHQRPKGTTGTMTLTTALCVEANPACQRRAQTPHQERKPTAWRSSSDLYRHQQLQNTLRWLRPQCFPRTVSLLMWTRQREDATRRARP